jgi:hypothetical protein
MGRRHDMTRMSCNGTTGQSEACHLIRTHVSVAAKEQEIIKANKLFTQCC